MTQIKRISTDLKAHNKFSFGFLKKSVNQSNPRRLEVPTFGIRVLLIVVNIFIVSRSGVGTMRGNNDRG